LLVLVHREDKEPEFGPARGQLPRSLQSRHARHRDIEDREVDVLVERALHRRGAVGGVGDDAEVRFCIEQLA
jgi:hypothetical protein